MIDFCPTHLCSAPGHFKKGLLSTTSHIALLSALKPFRLQRETVLTAIMEFAEKNDGVLSSKKTPANSVPANVKEKL